MNLEDFDFKAMDKEMARDEAAQVSKVAQATVVASKGSTPELVETNGGEGDV